MFWSQGKGIRGGGQEEWKEISSRFELFERLSKRTPIDKTIYESLHRGTRNESVLSPNGEFALVGIGAEGDLEGQRRYAWVE